MSDMMLYQAGLQLQTTLQVAEVMRFALELSVSFCPQMNSGRIYLVEGQKPVFGAAYWPNNGQLQMGIHLPADSATYQALQQGGDVLKRSNGHGDVIYALPLKSCQAIVGVLALHFTRANTLDEGTRDLLKLFSMQVGAALKNARQYELVSRQAHTDALTNLPNRRAFDDRLESETRRSSRYQHPFSLLMLDLDGFKGINDLFGHLAGDRVLQDIARLLSQSLRDTDFFARHGGDEFAIIFPETPREVAEKMAERLMEVVREWSDTRRTGASGGISLSVGLASYPENAITPTGLLTTADRALYAMKMSRKQPVI